MAIVVPPTNKAAARPISADLVMIFSKPTPPKDPPTGIGCSKRFVSVMKPRFHHAYKPFGTTNASGWVFRRGRFGEDHDKISTDRSSGGLVGGRNDDSHGSKC